MQFFEKVYFVCRLIPEGKVASYGQIAALLGNPRAARQVGWALRVCPKEPPVPAHRVINKTGFLSGAGAFFLENEQRMRLEAEGVSVSDDLIVDMKRFQWKPDEEELSRISSWL